jgi:DNA-binding MarR family transcriptional regulator
MDKEQHISTLWKHLNNMNRQLKQTFRIMNETTNVAISGISIMSQLEHTPLMKMNDVADYLCITLGAATSMIDKLEAQGWLDRIRSTEDRRIIYVQLTPEGKNKLQSIREHFVNQAKTIFDPLPAESIGELAEQIKLIEHYLSDYNHSPDKR